MKKDIVKEARSSVEIRDKAIALLATTTIIFTPSIFAFSFSNWFSSDKAASTEAQTATQASPQPVSIAVTPETQDTKVSQVAAKPIVKHHKKHHKKRKHRVVQAAPEKNNPSQITQFSSDIKEANNRNNEISLSGGITISTLNPGNQNITINDQVTNGYDTNPSTQVKGLAGLGYQRLFHLKHDLMMTAGPAFYYANLNTISGTEHPYVNGGNFDTLNYQYAAYSLSLMAESKLAYEKYSWQPFVTGGIGPSWNKLYNYSEAATDPNGSATASSSVFQNNIRAAFAYEVGLGVQHIFYCDPKHDVRYQASLAYKYFNFGSGQLNPATISTTGQAIKVNTLDTNAIIFSLGAVF